MTKHTITTTEDKKKEITRTGPIPNDVNAVEFLNKRLPFDVKSVDE